MVVMLIAFEFVAFSFLKVLLVVWILEMACRDLEIDIVEEVEQFYADLEFDVFEDEFTETERVLFLDLDFELVR